LIASPSLAWRIFLFVRRLKNRLTFVFFFAFAALHSLQVQILTLFFIFLDPFCFYFSGDFHLYTIEDDFASIFGLGSFYSVPFTPY